MATVNYVGRSLNVISRKGTAKESKVQETVIKQLKNGTLRTESGNEYQIADLYNKGKGVFVDVAGKGATAKPAATDNVKKGAAAPAAKPAPAGRAPAPAVTADELDGKKVNGLRVEKQIRSKGIVVLEGGVRVELANVVRRGKGFATVDGDNTPAPAPKTTAEKAPAKTGGAAPKGGAVPKGGATKKKANAIAALYSEPGVLSQTKDVRGKTVIIDGEEHTEIVTYKSGKCVSAEGYTFQLSDVRHIKAGGLAVLTDDYIAELEELYAQQEAKAKAAAPVAIKRTELKNQTLLVGKIEHTVVRTLKNNTVVTDRDFKCSVDEIARDGSGFVYTGKNLPRTGTALPRNRTAPSQVVRKVDVDAFDYDTTLDVKDTLREAVLLALKDTYNIDLVSATATQDGGNMMTVTFALAATAANKADIARKVKTLETGFAAVQQEQGHDFERHELTDAPLDPEEEEEEPDDVEEEEEEPEDEEPESFDEEEEEEPEDEEPESFEDEEPEAFDEEETETSFPLDATEHVNNAVARLEKMMPGRNLTAYVKLWYATQEVFDTIHYDIEPGQTVTFDGRTYILVGLTAKGQPLVVGPEKTARPGVTLASLLEAVEAE